MRGSGIPRRHPGEIYIHIMTESEEEKTVQKRIGRICDLCVLTVVIYIKLFSNMIASTVAVLILMIQ